MAQKHVAQAVISAQVPLKAMEVAGMAVTVGGAGEEGRVQPDRREADLGRP